MFIPETHGGTAGEANVFYAVGQHETLGFCPFGIDSFVEKEHPLLTDPNNNLGKSYEVLRSVAPAILQHEGRGEMAGFVLDKDHPQTTLELKGYRLDVSLDQIFETEAKNGYGLVIATGPDEFSGVGRGVRGSYLAICVNLKEEGQPAGLEPRVEGKAANLHSRSLPLLFPTHKP